MLLALLGIAIVVGILVAVYLARQPSGGTSKIAGGMAKIATGDTSDVVAIGSNDELGDMAGAYADMVGYLNEMAEGPAASLMATSPSKWSPSPRMTCWVTPSSR